MKKIAVVVPTYNEEENVETVYRRLTAVFETALPQYDYTIMYIDNFSQDSTRSIIERLSKKDKHVCAIFNARNFGFIRSTFYGLTRPDADCTFMVFADMQDPPELLPEFVKKWEEGYKVVVGVKKTSKERPLMFALRTVYYKMIEKISDTEQIEHFNGYGLYDRKFIEVIRNLDDPMPYLKGIVSELGFRRTELYYNQDVRIGGKTNFNLFKLYDVAMLGVTCYSKVLLRIATFVGGFIGGFSILLSLYVMIKKLIMWNSYAIGLAALTCGVFFIGGITLFFLGILGEYVLNINSRTLHRPLVIEECRINFTEESPEQTDEKESTV
ncbi:glycosyltransferase family 2 protein [uncultured Oscillibacter sp.]|uniref:glycosyltransferase family 2 protein n=1 Tax=uncultured Oscillibacter sp. TaxID=876091 RepID=UPI0025E3707A|nr:glycosyltransferase family 2 protein [uncultured Oscillibacter sp.]